MNIRRIGVEVPGTNASEVLERVQYLEKLGIQAAWLSDGEAAMDPLTLIGAAAVKTDRILLGTAIVRTWPRHPIVAAQQVQVIEKLAPGRLRLGLGPSHRDEMEGMFGFEFDAPLGHLREYVRIVKALLREGKVDYDGRHYHAHARISEPLPKVPVMISALRKASFRLCGAEADGAISWVCPGEYLRDVALPAMKEGAREAGRPTQPLIAHAVVCVHESPQEVKTAALKEMEYYPTSHFYQRMFADAGFPEAEETRTWSDRMLEAVVLSGSEEKVADRLTKLFDWGAGELLVSILAAGRDKKRSQERSLRLLSQASEKL